MLFITAASAPFAFLASQPANFSRFEFRSIDEGDPALLYGPIASVYPGSQISRPFELYRLKKVLIERVSRRQLITR